MERIVIRGILIGFVLVALSACAGIQKKKEADSKSAEAFYELGVQYLNDRNYQSALVELRKAAAVQPDDERVYNAMGLVYFYTERFGEAEKAYKRALSSKKDYPEARVNLGSLYARQERYKEAIVQYEKALEDPFYLTPVTALHNIGRCYQRMGDVGEAEDYFRQAMQQDPDWIAAYFDLGKLYYRNNQMEKAIGVFSQALGRHSKDLSQPDNALSLSYLHYWLGLSYFKNGDPENAVLQFREVTKLSSNDRLTEEASKYLDLLE